MGGRGNDHVLSGAALPGPTTLMVAATRVLSGLGEQHWAGWAVATGDLDGDGQPDLAAGAPGADDGAGMVLIWLGADLFTTRDGFPDVRLYGDEKGDGFGRSVSIADTDGDGLDDLLVGAPRRNPSPKDNPEFFDSGALYLFRGAPELRTWRPVLFADDADARWAQAGQFLRNRPPRGRRRHRWGRRGGVALVHRFAPSRRTPPA